MELRDLSIFSVVNHLAGLRLEDTTLIGLGAGLWYMNETEGCFSFESDLKEILYISVCK